MRLYVVLALLFAGCAEAAARPNLVNDIPVYTPPSVTAVNAPGIYHFDGEIDELSTSRLGEFLASQKQNGLKAVTIYINSPGGQVFAGMDMVRRMEDSGLQTRCVVDGLAASMAFYMLQGCDKREMTKRSILMAHEPSGTVGGPGWEHENAARFLRALAHAMAEHCAARMKVSVDEYEQRISGGREWYFSIKDALGFGAIDAVATRQ